MQFSCIVIRFTREDGREVDGLKVMGRKKVKKNEALSSPQPVVTCYWFTLFV